MIEFGQIITLINTAQKIEKFIEGELNAILSAIGENEFQAAAKALDDVQHARDRGRLVEQALSHLRSAHTAYESIYTKKRPLRDVARMATLMEARQKDVFTLCLMAICYQYLGEQTLMERSLAVAHEAIKPWTAVRRGYTIGDLIDDPVTRKAYFRGCFSAVASWFNLATHRTSWKFVRGNFPEISEPELLQFSTALRQVPGAGSSGPGKKNRGKRISGI